MIEIRRQQEEEAEELDPKKVFEESFISQEEALERVTKNSLEWQYLIGSGVSVSSAIPSSKEMIDDISVRVFEKMHPAKRGMVTPADIADWLFKEKWFSQDYQYITCLEKEYPANTLRREYFGHILEGKDPSPGHYTLALAVKFKKICPLIYTTNWDTLLEDAFYILRGITCIAIKDIDSIGEIKEDDRHYVWKLHGSYDNYNVTYLREGMGKLHDDTREKLRESLKNVGLVVIGYGGLEYSIMNTLIELVEDEPEVLNKGLIWGFRDNIKRPPVQIMQLFLKAREAGKDFTAFEIESSDNFFEQLGKKLGLPQIEEEMKYTFSYFNHSSYSDLKPRADFDMPEFVDFVDRDLTDEGFLISDFNEILEMNKAGFRDIFKKKADREREQKDFEQRMLVNAFNDLKRGDAKNTTAKFDEVLNRFPRAENAYFGKGWGFYQLGEYDKSIEFFNKAMKLNDKNKATWLALALANNKAGNHAEEIKCWQKCTEFKKPEDYMYYNAALAHHYNEDIEGERAGYQKCLSIYKRHPDSWYNLGIIYYQDGNILDALSCFQNAYEARDKHAYAWYNSGIILGKVGQNNRALEYIEKAYDLRSEADILFNRGCALVNTKHWDEALENYEYYLESYPDDIYAWNNLGLARFFTDEFEKSRELFDRVISERPDEAKTYFNRARSLWKLGEKEKALEDFNKCIDLESEYELVFYIKSRLLHEMERFEAEIDSLIYFLSKNPEDYRAWYELGHAYRSLSDTKSAAPEITAAWEKEVESYLRSLELNPMNLDVLLDLGIAYNKLGRYHDAIECFERIVRSELRNPDVYFNWALSLDQLEDFLKAIEHYERTIKLKPDYIKAWLNKGTILAKLEQYAKAIDCYEEVLKIDPENSAAWQNRGLAYVPLKEFGKARELLLEGMRKFPDEHIFPLNFAYLTIFTGERELGQIMLHKAGEINPDAINTAEASPELGQLFPIEKGIESKAREYFRKFESESAGASAGA